MELTRKSKGSALLPEHFLEDLEDRYAAAMRRWQLLAARKGVKALGKMRLLSKRMS